MYIVWRLLVFVTNAYIILIHCQECCGKCTSSWSSFGENCYKHFTVASSWDNARLQCEAENAYLVIISSEEENVFVNHLNPQYTWIGLRDIDTQPRTFKWINNKPLEYSNWRNGEPNNNNEDCIHMYSDGKWNDNTCSRTFTYVCEKERRFREYTAKYQETNKCFSTASLDVLTVGRQLTESPVRCLKYCTSIDACASFQITHMSCNALGPREKDAVYEYETLQNCFLFHLS